MPTASAAASAGRCTSSTSSTASSAPPASSAATSRSRSAPRWPPARSGGDRVTVVFFGDGAVQAGHFNETINLATLWGLPLDHGLREQRLRRVHAALGPHQGRAGERRRRALRARPARPSTATTSAAVWDAFGELPRRRAQGRGPDAARVPDPPAARPLRGRPGRSTARRWPTRSGSERTRSMRLQAHGPRPTAGSTRRRRASVEAQARERSRRPRSRSPAESPYPPPRVGEPSSFTPRGLMA